MMTRTLKPGWLVRLQDALRARPMTRAALWAVVSGSMVHAYLAIVGQAPTGSRVLVEIGAWALGAVVFYLVMRWWEANDRAR